MFVRPVWLVFALEKVLLPSIADAKPENERKKATPKRMPADNIPVRLKNSFERGFILYLSPNISYTFGGLILYEYCVSAFLMVTCYLPSIFLKAIQMQYPMSIRQAMLKKCQEIPHSSTK
jgi:hypothetical protein